MTRTGWAGRRVVLGVAGGIAAYKSATLARRLAEGGAEVDVVLTRGAAEFIGAATFEALTGRPVLTSLWEPGAALAHVRWGQQADLILIAPATAHLLARAAQGLADDHLTALLLASTAPVLAAPAMNDAMYAHPATQANLDLLRARGWSFAGPGTGALAEGPSDRPGRMLEPEAILAHAERVLGRGGPLDGKRVCVTAGPTREGIDPVRVITNRSSGRMGYRLAEAAWARGAEVILVSGPTALPAPEGIEVVRIESTAELHASIDELLPGVDLLVMAAAPADYRPAEVAAVKRPRSEGPLVLTFEGTDDILRATRARRKPGAVIVGFALETGDGAIARARGKLEAKALDLVVVNDALEEGAGPEGETNRVTILSRSAAAVEVPLGSKRAVADAILDVVETALG